MNWFSREERTGNFPIWLEYDLAVLELTSMMTTGMLWERCCCLGVCCQGNIDVIGWKKDFFCSWSRWPFTVKEYWGRCLERRLAETPGHDLKWHLLMASIKVDLAGLKVAAWKYWVNSRFVVS